MIFDVAIITVWGHHERHPYNCVLTALPTGHSTVSPPLFVPLNFLRYNSIEIRPMNKFLEAIVGLNERKSRMSHLKSKARMIKLSEEGRSKAERDRKLGLLVPNS